MARIDGRDASVGERLHVDGLALERAVIAEPLAVALHAFARAGDVSGRTVFIAGAGPIGCLVAAAARAKGAAEIVVSDLLDELLRLARASAPPQTVSATDAFALACDRTRASKVLLDLGGDP